MVLLSAARGLVLVVRVAELDRDPNSRYLQLQACMREARLADVPLLLAGADELVDDHGVRRLLKLVHGPVLLTMRTLAAGIMACDRPVISHEVTSPSTELREKAWRKELPDQPQLAIDCARRFRFPISVTREISGSLGVEPTIETIQNVTRARFDRQLSGFAKRVAWAQTWDDLVLPDDQIDLLVELIARVRHRDRVLRDWGFAGKVAKGFGVSALFSGPPGTGKTMIAGLIAKDLGLDLYQVDLSKIVSKYIGETEKQLAALFDAAELGHAVILFDEADSLFGKRTEVRSSNDRYANLETNYLLQRLESFEGICILTTNHESAIDEAFMRRLALHVRVPMPDEDHRQRLWAQMIPHAAETSGKLDFTELAKHFVMSGGYIKNAVVRAAYLAAADGGAIAQRHFERAARAEYEAMGKVAFHRSHL